MSSITCDNGLASSAPWAIIIETSQNFARTIGDERQLREYGANFIPDPFHASNHQVTLSGRRAARIIERVTTVENPGG